jgi:hypothetical protein
MLNDNSNGGSDNNLSSAIHSKEYKNFQKRLDRLVKLKENLNESEKLEANETSKEKLN